MLVGGYECKGGKRAVQVTDEGAAFSTATHGSGTEGFRQMHTSCRALFASQLRFTLREVAREGEQQARALFKHGTCGGTAAHLCGNIREALAQGKTENEDESRASGKPVGSLTLKPNVCTNTI
ncbi:hypothetical protein E1301_Tti011129 [Triplophysa tibetana]|uniref:Uncharacterized protein n=1 Tax=Triplophysa tibetana TaxID=1572043 RepID=A0A5A9NQS3_9TELE|nr:hypothetical protein E1301_Tti011129 [Triplophysa tibetana]